MFNLFYYYFYLFYTRVLPDDEPHATVVYTLGFTEGLFVNGLLKILLANFFCLGYGKWIGLGIAAAIIVFNYFFYIQGGRGKNIINEKSAASLSKPSMLLTALFTILSVSFLFWGSGYVRDVLNNC